VTNSVSEKRGRGIGRLCVVSSALLWGLAGVCVKSITWSSFSLMATRSVISLIMLLVYRGTWKAKWSGKNFMGGLMMALTGILYMASIKLTAAGTAIVLQYVAPVLVFLYGIIFRGKKAKLYEVATVVLVFGGVILSFADTIFAESIDVSMLFGDLLGLASGVVYAAQIVIMNDAGCDAEDSTMWGNIIGIALSFPFMFFDEGLTLSMNNIIWVLILGIFQYGVANILFAKGIQKVSAVEGSLLLTIEPIFNPIPVAIICGEVMGPLAIVGAIVVISGVTLHILLPGWLNKKRTKES